MPRTSLSRSNFSFSCSFRQKLCQTRMHSSKMPRGCLPRRVSAQGGVCPGGWLPRGLCLPWRVSAWRVYNPHCMLGYTAPPVDRILHTCLTQYNKNSKLLFEHYLVYPPSKLLAIKNSLRCFTLTNFYPTGWIKPLQCSEHQVVTTIAK